MARKILVKDQPGRLQDLKVVFFTVYETDRAPHGLGKTARLSADEPELFSIRGAQ